MSVFGKIKDAIFGGPATAKETKKPEEGGAWTSAPVVDRKSVDEVDVEAQLAAKDGADKFNWRTSIVDLLKLLGIDSSYDNRKALAQELGRDDYEGSAEDNIWLHKRTMRELAANGGKVPADMLD